MKVFHAVIERITAFIATQIVWNFETQLLLQRSERKAELLHRAAELNTAGLPHLAEELQTQAQHFVPETTLAQMQTAAQSLPTLETRPQLPPPTPVPLKANKPQSKATRRAALK